jgi:hypothetical protein
MQDGLRFVVQYGAVDFAPGRFGKDLDVPPHEPNLGITHGDTIVGLAATFAVAGENGGNNDDSWQQEPPVHLLSCMYHDGLHQAFDAIAVTLTRDEPRPCALSTDERCQSGNHCEQHFGPTRRLNYLAQASSQPKKNANRVPIPNAAIGHNRFAHARRDLVRRPFDRQT